MQNMIALTSSNLNLSSISSIPTRTPLKKNTRFWSPIVFSKQVLDSNVSESISIPTHQVKRRCECFDLHKELVPYIEAWSWQKSIVKERIALAQLNEDHSDTLIILQHNPVYTLGTRSSEEYLNFDLKEAPFHVYRTERGGEVTYHGPGQLVMYPIINLRYHQMDLHWYLRELEEVVIRVLSSAFSIKASRLKGLTGVWVGDQKLAAVGIRVSQWITYHGVALNVTTDMTPFRSIVPCGIQDRRVGSIKGLLTEFLTSDGCGAPDINLAHDNKLIDLTHKALIKEFTEVFRVELCQKPICTLDLLETKRSTSLT